MMVCNHFEIERSLLYTNYAFLLVVGEVPSYRSNGLDGFEFKSLLPEQTPHEHDLELI